MTRATYKFLEGKKFLAFHPPPRNSQNSRNLCVFFCYRVLLVETAKMSNESSIYCVACLPGWGPCQCFSLCNMHTKIIVFCKAIPDSSETRSLHLCRRVSSYNAF